jgi:hypothetical protein
MGHIGKKSRAYSRFAESSLAKLLSLRDRSVRSNVNQDAKVGVSKQAAKNNLSD